MRDIVFLCDTIQDLLDSASQEGCTPDLAVVDARYLLDLAEAAGLEPPKHIRTEEVVE
jgi:hypothetical protein